MRKKPVRLGMILGANGCALLGLFLLSNCSTVDSTMSPLGGAGTPPSNQKTATIGTGPGAQASDIDCPSVTVRSGAAAWQVSAGAGATNVRYQGSLGQLARECAILGETMTMRVGVEGRVLVGPKGGPGTVNVPIRIALVQEGSTPKPILSKFYSVPVNIPPGASQAIFSQVEDDLTFPMPSPPSALEKYVVYVGFDPRGAVPEKGTKQKASPASGAQKPSPATAPVASRPRPQPNAVSKSTPPAGQPAFESPPPKGGGGGQDDLFAPPPGHRGS